MKRRMERGQLGRSNVEVSRLALGTAPLGGLFTHVDSDEAERVVTGALEAGIRYFDTAPQYGHGTAEVRLGSALAGVRRDQIVVSTKVGRLIEPGSSSDTGIFVDAPPSVARFDFSPEATRRSLEESLERLRLDRVDIVYIHDPDEHEEQAIAESYPVLHDLRREGVVGAIGVGMNQSRIPARFVRETEIDVVLLAGRFTLLDQSGADDLLPACVERGVSVVAGGVFNSGILADPSPGATYDYAPAPAGLLDRAQRMAAICARHGTTLAAAAVQFALSHPAVASVLVGTRSTAELDQILDGFEQPLPAELWESLVSEGLLPAEYRPSP
jgi:D-threo-aldose 1-dehydrogenase